MIYENPFAPSDEHGDVELEKAEPYEIHFKPDSLRDDLEKFLKNTTIALPTHEQASSEKIIEDLLSDLVAKHDENLTLQSTDMKSLEHDYEAELNGLEPEEYYLQPVRMEIFVRLFFKELAEHNRLDLTDDFYEKIERQVQPEEEEIDRLNELMAIKEAVKERFPDTVELSDPTTTDIFLNVAGRRITVSAIDSEYFSVDFSITKHDEDTGVEIHDDTTVSKGLELGTIQVVKVVKFLIDKILEIKDAKLWVNASTRRRMEVYKRMYKRMKKKFKIPNHRIHFGYVRDRIER